MLSVSVVFVINIVVLNLEYACCWDTLQHPFDRLNIRSIDDPSNAGIVTLRWFKEPLDHFDPNEKRTINIKYFQRLDMWQPDGPVYVWLDHFSNYDSDEIEALTSDGLLPVILAKETNGSLFRITQRYYMLGQGIHLPLDKDYYKFMNTTQSLADIADFIKFIKASSRLQSSKVVIIGFGDTGTLGTWFRMVYPDLVDAVVAISAPLLAKKDYKQFYDVVRDDYDKYGSKRCLTKIENYFHTIGELFDNETGIEKLKKMFNICDHDNFTMTIDRQYFMELRFSDYYRVALYENPNSIKSKCDHTPTKLINMTPWYCHEYHMDFFTGEFRYLYASFYQACSEFGRFATTSEKQPFAHYNPVEYFVNKCKHFFGIDEQRIDAGIAETNRMFGGLTPNVSNVVFTWGDMDPYRPLGVQKNLSDSAPAFVINGASRYNIHEINNDETKELTETRNRVKSLIKKWIGSS